MENGAGPLIQTPLGPLGLEAILGGVRVELSDLRPIPHTSFRRADWVHKNFRVSLWLGTLASNLLIDPDLLPKQGVEGCWGVLWRVEALRDMPEEERLSFRCCWANPSPLILSQTAGYDSGATVDAWHWWDGPVDVCVGTSNALDLAFLGRQGGFALPERWYDPAQPDDELSLPGVEATRMSEHGLEVAYPALRGGEVCHATFSVAWKTLRVQEDGEPDGEDSDTWMAVDLASAVMVRAVSALLEE